jgi:hypothetical protein
MLSCIAFIDLWFTDSLLFVVLRVCVCVSKS